MVKVLPEPVCPYAIMVPLYPWKQASMRFFAHSSNTLGWQESEGNTRSKRNFLFSLSVT